MSQLGSVISPGIMWLNLDKIASKGFSSELSSTMAHLSTDHPVQDFLLTQEENALFPKNSVAFLSHSSFD